MRVIPIHRDDDVDYSCISYWVLGESHASSSVNTLIDVGSVHPENLPYFLHVMSQQAKGIGKRAVEQVILTHAHFDHTGGLAGIESHFEPEVYAWLPQGVRHHCLYDGLHLQIGDQSGKLLHTPGHSEDSICVYLPESGILFSGDTLYRINDNRGVYPSAYLKSLERLSAMKVEAIYPGHGIPILKDASGFIESCLEKVGKSHFRD